MNVVKRIHPPHLPEGVLAAMMRFGPLLIAVLVWILLALMMEWPRIAGGFGRH